MQQYLQALKNTEYPQPAGAEVRKNARLMGQGIRGENASFANLPDEVAINIASFFGDPKVHKEDGLEKIKKFASDHLRIT